MFTCLILDITGSSLSSALVADFLFFSFFSGFACKMKNQTNLTNHLSLKKSIAAILKMFLYVLLKPNDTF